MSRLLDKEYREMYADIKPSGLLIAEVKEKMKKEPDLKKLRCGVVRRQRLSLL